jgi:hypothetical protein
MKRVKTLFENMKTLDVSLIQGSRSLMRSMMRESEKDRSIRETDRESDENRYLCESGVCFESSV